MRLRAFVLISLFLSSLSHQSYAENLQDKCSVSVSSDNGFDQIEMSADAKLTFDFAQRVSPLSRGLIEEIFGTVANTELLPAALVAIMSAEKANLLKLKIQKVQVLEMIAEGGLDWIGVEATDEEVQETLAKNFTERAQMTESLRSFGVTNPQILDDLQLLLHGPVLKLMAEHPAFLSKIKIVGLDDRNLERQDHEALANSLKAQQKMIAMSVFGDDASKLPTGTYRLYILAKEMAFAAYQIPPDDVIDKVLDTLPDPDAKKLGEFEIRERIKYIQLGDPRSRAAVRSAVTQKGNGLILYGALHKDVALSELIDHCEKSGPH